MDVEALGGRVLLLSAPALPGDDVLPPHAEAVANALSRRFRPALMAFFLRRIRNHSEAEDLTQDVLMRVSEKGSFIDANHWSFGLYFVYSSDILFFDSNYVALRHGIFYSECFDCITMGHSSF